MQIRQYPGSNPAHIPNIATEPPRFPHDYDVDDFEPSDEAAIEPDAWRLHLKATDEPAMTAKQYWSQRQLEELESQPRRYIVSGDEAASPVTMVFDDYTIDAEILVDRDGGRSFTRDELAAFFGVGEGAVRYWRKVGKLPEPAVPFDGGGRFGVTVEAQWSRAQVVDFLAGILRSNGAA